MKDKELDDLEKELAGTPHVEKPAEIQLQNGLGCWLNPIRVCGPDCVAFNTDELNEHGEIASPGPNQCTVLYYIGQGSHASHLQGVLATKQLKVLQDKQRTSGPMPPPVQK